MIGSFITGPIAYIGRWKILMLCNLLIIISSVVQVIPGCFGNLYIFTAAKFIFGMACGGFSVICPKYVQETTP